MYCRLGIRVGRCGTSEVSRGCGTTLPVLAKSFSLGPAAIYVRGACQMRLRASRRLLFLIVKLENSRFIFSRLSPIFALRAFVIISSPDGPFFFLFFVLSNLSQPFSCSAVSSAIDLSYLRYFPKIAGCSTTGSPADFGGYVSEEPLPDVHRVDALDVI